MCLNSDGYAKYSFERMLIDKISVLYSNKDSIIRRIRDVYDIYCIYTSFSKSLNMSLMVSLLPYRQIDLYQKSAFESLLESSPSEIIIPLQKMLIEDVRVDKSIGSKINICDILETVLVLLNRLRGLLIS